MRADASNNRFSRWSPPAVESWKLPGTTRRSAPSGEALDNHVAPSQGRRGDAAASATLAAVQRLFDRSDA
jgi:hypothetical protein